MTLWPSIWKAVVHCYNRSPHSSINFQLPISVLAPNRHPRPDVSYLRILGSYAYAHVLKSERSHKFSPVAEKLVLVGYSDSSKGYCLWNPVTNTVIERFDVTETVPLEPSAVRSLHPHEGEATPVERARFGELIGSLLYLATRTRPDIATAVSFLSRFTANPAPAHWAGLKRIVRYLKGTVNHGLFYPQNDKSVQLDAYSDSDWGCAVTDRKSISGYIIRYGTAVIDWRSGRQTCVALSSTEAELIAATEACKEISWLRQIYNTITGDRTATKLYIDNRGAIELASDPRRTSKRSKHIDLRHFYVRECVTDGKVDVLPVPTTENLADGMTKGLPAPAFSKFRDAIGVQPSPSAQDIKTGTG